MHGKDERHHHATVVFSRVFAHDGRADRVVSADADAQDEAQPDEPQDIRGKGAGNRAGRQHQHLDSVNPLATKHVGHPAKEQRTQCCGEQGCRFYEAFFELAKMPDIFQQRHDHADDEQIVGIGEKAHSGDKHDLPVVG